MCTLLSPDLFHNLTELLLFVGVYLDVLLLKLMSVKPTVKVLDLLLGILLAVLCVYDTVLCFQTSAYCTVVC